MVESIGDRIKRLVEALGIKKVRFAEQIKVDQSYITQIIKGRNIPSDRVIDNICYKFHVNEKWLRTGEEPMFIEPTSFDLNEFAKNNGATELELNFLKAYFGLPSKVRSKLIAYFKDSLADNTTEVSAEIKPEDIPAKVNKSAEIVSKDADEEDYANVARKQRILEKKPDVSASSAKESGAG